MLQGCIVPHDWRWNNVQQHRTLCSTSGPTEHKDTGTARAPNCYPHTRTHARRSPLTQTFCHFWQWLLRSMKRSASGYSLAPYLVALVRITRLKANSETRSHVLLSHTHSTCGGTCWVNILISRILDLPSGRTKSSCDARIDRSIVWGEVCVGKTSYSGEIGRVSNPSHQTIWLDC